MATEKQSKTMENVEKDLSGAESTQNVNSEKQPIPGKTDANPKMTTSSNKKSCLLMGFGAFGVVMGAIAVVYWPPLFFAQLRRMMTLTPSSMSFEIWRDVPIPMYLEAFMWNIANVDEILANKSTKIKVVQMGPYVFKENHVRKNLTWNDHNNTITYYNERQWHFQPDMSNGSLSDQVTSINPVIATVAYIMRYQRNIIKIPVDVFLRTVHDNLFITRNVSTWLFDGIEDPVLDIASHIPNFPIVIPYDKFGWFYDRNNSMTYDGSFNMNTGAENFDMLGMVQKWNFKNRTNYRDKCGEVRGSTGELWAPELGQPEVEVFSSDLCTYLTLAKNESVTVDGIEGVLYAANDSVFDNGYRYPERACYCDEIRDENCLPPGALNVSECRYGAPAFVSLPHFYNSDPYYPSKIEGLNPVPEHNFRLALEMYTGMPLSVSAQLQINLLVRHVPGITINNILPDNDTLVPMFWFRQEVRVTPEYARLAKFALNLKFGVPYGLYALTALGVALLLSGVIILVRKLLRSPDTAPILPQEEGTSTQIDR